MAKILEQGLVGVIGGIVLIAGMYLVGAYAGLKVLLGVFLMITGSAIQTSVNFK